MADRDVLALLIDPGDSAQKVEECRKKIAELDAIAKALAATYKGGGMAIDEYTAKNDALERAIKRVVEAEKQATAAARDRTSSVAGFTSSVDSIADGGGKGGRGAVLQIGRIAQDLTQGGIGSIANNLIEIAPVLGVAALLIDGISKNADTIADKFKAWGEEIRGTNSQLESTLSISESFFRNFSSQAAGNFWGDFAEKMAKAFDWRAGPGGVATNALALLFGGGVDPAANADKKREAKEAAEGRENLDKVLGEGQKGRQKALRDTIEDVGGGKEFAAVFADMDKKSRDAMARNVARVLGKGDEAAFAALQDQLTKAGRGDLAKSLALNMPASKSDEENYKYEEDRFDKAQKAHEQAKKRQQKEDEDNYKYEEDRFEESQRKYAAYKAKRKREQTGQARDSLEEMDGLRGNASLTYARYLMNGSTPDAAANDIASQIQLELEKRGIDSGVAKEQAGDYARGVRKDVGNRIAMAGMQAERTLEKPQVFGLADANKLAQEAGPKVQEEQRDLLKIAVERLAGIERNSLGGAVVGP